MIGAPSIESTSGLSEWKSAYKCVWAERTSAVVIAITPVDCNKYICMYMFTQKKSTKSNILPIQIVDSFCRNYEELTFEISAANNFASRYCQCGYIRAK